MDNVIFLCLLSYVFAADRYRHDRMAFQKSKQSLLSNSVDPFVLAVPDLIKISRAWPSQIPELIAGTELESGTSENELDTPMDLPTAELIKRRIVKLFGEKTGWGTIQYYKWC